MAGKNASPAFKCRFCPSTFARQEHLSRHTRSHTRQRPYKCLECGKAFSRQDVLNRHTTGHAQTATETQTASSRACTECAIGRVRCSKEARCKRCVDRGLECLYPPSRQRKASSSDRSNPMGATSPATSPEGETIGNAGEDDQLRHVEIPDGANPNQSDDNIELGGVNSHLPSMASNPSVGAFPHVVAWADGIDPGHNHRPSPNLPAEYFTARSPTGFMSGPTIEQQALGMSSINWLSPDIRDSLYWNNALATFLHGAEPFENSSMPYASNMNPVGTSTWHPATGEGLTAAESLIQQTMGSQGSSAPDFATRPPASVGSAVESGASRSTEGALYVDGAVSRAPFRGRFLSRQPKLGGSSPFTNDCLTEATAPGCEGFATSGEHGTDCAGDDFVLSTTYDNLCRQLRTDTETLSPLSRPDPEFIPSLGQISLFSSLYFEKFHPTFPFLRRHASLLEQADSWILLLAISAVGAIYSGQSPFNALSGLLDKVLRAREASAIPGDSPDPWLPGDSMQTELNLPTVQAEILSLVCLIHSGNKQLTRAAFSKRHQLVEECRRRGMLSRKLPTPEQAFLDNESMVAAWLEAQGEIRTGMMIWALDSIIAYEFNCSHLLLLNDAKSPLPSLESIWNHPTAGRIRDSSPMPMLEALELLYMEKCLPGNLSEYSTLLVIFGICRRTKEAIYRHQTSLSDWIPNARIQPRTYSHPAPDNWPPSLPLVLGWRNSACDCLDILHWNANSIAAKAGGWEHPTILYLHLSRLLLLTPAQHIQYVAAESLRMPWDAEKRSVGYSDAYNHIQQWALLDQFKARLSMVHAGALLWHIRRYSSDGFLEPFAVYLAILALWSYSFSTQCTGQQADGEAEAQQFGGGDGIGDMSAHLAEGTLPTSSDWDEPEPSFILLDRPCDDEIVQLYIQMGHKMTAHILRVGNICSPGSPRRILEEGLRMLTRKNDQGPSGTSVASRGLGTWGIRESFAETLRSLIRTTEPQPTTQA